MLLEHGQTALPIDHCLKEMLFWAALLPSFELSCISFDAPSRHDPQLAVSVFPQLHVRRSKQPRKERHQEPLSSRSGVHKLNCTGTILPNAGYECECVPCGHSKPAANSPIFFGCPAIVPREMNQSFHFRALLPSKASKANSDMHWSLRANPHRKQAGELPFPILNDAAKAPKLSDSAISSLVMFLCPCPEQWMQSTRFILLGTESLSCLTSSSLIDIWSPSALSTRSTTPTDTPDFPFSSAATSQARLSPAFSAIDNWSFQSRGRRSLRASPS